MDTTIFLDINHFATRTAYLHKALADLSGAAGLALLVAALVIGLVQVYLGRSRRHAGPLGALWALVAVALSAGLGELIGRLLDRAGPDQTLKGIEVLGTGGGGFALPDLRIAVAAAACAALVVLGARVSAAIALIVTLLLGFTEIYVGAHYPIDELAGLGLGAAVALLGWPLLRAVATGGAGAHRTHALSHAHAVSLTGELAALGRPVAGPSGPAAQPVPIAASGSVRLLEAPRTGELGTLPPPLRRRAAPFPPASAQGPAQSPVPAGAPAGATSAVPGGATSGSGAESTGLATGGTGHDAPRETIAIFPRPPERVLGGE